MLNKYSTNIITLMAAVVLSLAECSILSLAVVRFLSINGETGKERLRNNKIGENINVKTVKDK
jgi:hypothetical protein